LEWAQVRALVADGVSQREIAIRLGIKRSGVSWGPMGRCAMNGRRTGRCSTRWSRMRRLIEEWPEIKVPRVAEMLRRDYGYVGSVDLVLKRMAALRPPKGERAAERTGYRPGQVMQVDWRRCRRVRGLGVVTGASLC
jgi:transposase